MLHVLPRAAAVLSVAVLLAGCVTTGLYETARTTPPGQWQIGGCVTPIHMAFTEDGVAGRFLPIPELYARVGLSDNFDLGARWSFGPGIQLNGKGRISKGAVDVAMHGATSFYGFFMSGYGFGLYTLTPRLVVSQENAGSFPFAINAGVSYTGLFAGGDGEGTSGGTLGAVTGIGLPFRLGISRSLLIMPELAVSVPLFSSVEYEGEQEIITGLDQFGLSLGASVGYAGRD